MPTGHLRADAHKWGDKQEQAWRDWDVAVAGAQAMGWHLQVLTGRLLAANCQWGARRAGEIDRILYRPTLDLSTVSRVTRALAAATAYDRAVVASGLTGLIRELEEHGKHNRQVADAAAEWADRIERVRDGIAGAGLGLKGAYVVAVGGGTRAPSRSPKTPELAW